jgi:hypothetical protein
MFGFGQGAPPPGAAPRAQKAAKPASKPGEKRYGLKSAEGIAATGELKKKKQAAVAALEDEEEKAIQRDIDITYANAITAPAKGRTHSTKTIKDKTELYDEIISSDHVPFYFATAEGVYIDLRYPRLDTYTVLQRTPEYVTLNNNQIGGAGAVYRIDPTGRIIQSNGSPLGDPLLENLIMLPRKLYKLTSSIVHARVDAAEPAPRNMPSYPEMPGSTIVTPAANAASVIYGWNYRDRLGGLYAIQSDNEYVTYIRHLKYTTDFSNAGIEATTDLRGLAELAAGVAKTRGFETLRKVLLHCKNTPALVGIWNRYKTYSFLRNVIDFLHDYVHEGAKLIAELYRIAGATPGFDGALIAAWMPPIQTAITAGGKVNQTTCKLLSKNLATAFKREIKGHRDIAAYLSWLVVEKDDALVATANKSFPAEIQAMLRQAKSNGCSGLYIESLATSATRLFSQIPDDPPSMGYMDVLSGHWDAGSGISYLEAAKARPGLQRLLITRLPAIESFASPEIRPGQAGVLQLARSVNAGGANTPAIVLGDSAVGGFGLFPVMIDEGNSGKLLTNSPTVRLEIYPRTKLSVNGLLTSVGLPGVRGTGEPMALINIATTPATDLKSADLSTKLAVLCLKQWTDTIQTDDIVNSERHILMAYSDYDAEEYCAMIGGTSIMQKGREFNYYCYDVTKRQVPEPELNRKRKTLRWAQSNAAAIQRYVECWHRNAISSLNFIVQDTEDPTVFFAAVAILNRLYENNSAIAASIATHITNKDINNTMTVSLSPSTGEELLRLLTNNNSIVALFDEMYENLSRVFNDITTIRAARLNPSVFIHKFDAIQQQIINSLPTMPSDVIYEQITILFFAYGFLLPFDEVAYSSDAAAAAGLANKNRTIDNIIVSLDSTIDETDDANTSTKLENVKQKIEALRNTDLSKVKIITQLGGDIRNFVRSFNGDVVGCSAAELPPAAMFPALPARGGRRRRRTNRRRGLRTSRRSRKY